MKSNNSFWQGKRLFFNIWANFYDVLWTTIFYQAVHQRLLEFVSLSENSLVLDLGCGTGKLLDRLGNRFPNIKAIGMDLSPQMLKQARANNRYHDRFIFTLGNATELPFANNQFDAVFNTISFLHYPQPEVVLQEVSRVLKTQGYFYLADYTGMNGMKEVNFFPGGIRFYSRQDREAMGAKVGLQVIVHHYLLFGVVLTIFQKNSV